MSKAERTNETHKRRKKTTEKKLIPQTRLFCIKSDLLGLNANIRFVDIGSAICRGKHHVEC